MPQSAQFLICPPTAIRIEDGDSPFDDGVRQPLPDVVRSEWARVLAWMVHEARARVATLYPDTQSPHLWTTARAGLVHQGIAIPASPREEFRRQQIPRFVRAFTDAGCIVEPLPESVAFAGAVDVQMDDEGVLWVAYGPSTDASVPWELADRLGGEIRSLTLASRRYGFLERTLRVLPGRRLLWYPPGFDPASADAIRSAFPASRRKEIETAEADNLACASVIHGNHLLMPAASPTTLAWLKDQGFVPTVVALPEMRFYGASASTIVLRLDE
jgi:N-dimethylarginine dimethylaminohydrolase